jgi:predicted RND superfamily exporter protein
MDEIAKSVLKYQAGAGHLVTGMVPLFLRTQQAVLDSLMSSFLLAFAVIAVVMAIVLKNPIAGLISMLPNILPVGVVFGLISWGGLRVDIGTMVTASVALGIAVDGTLHLLTWFRDGAARGLSRRDAIAQALGHCGPAMWQTSAAVGVGLLVLYPADLLLISRFGWLMAALIGAALLADVILLPALLAGPLGTLIERSVSAKQNATSSPLPPTPEASASLPHRSPVHAHHFDSASQKAGKTLRVD